MAKQYQGKRSASLKANRLEPAKPLSIAARLRAAKSLSELDRIMDGSLKAAPGASRKTQKIWRAAYEARRKVLANVPEAKPSEEASEALQTGASEPQEPAPVGSSQMKIEEVDEEDQESE